MFKYFVVLLISLTLGAQEQALEEDWISPSKWMQGDKELYDLGEILMNKLEVADIFHQKQTIVHPRARLTVHKVFDPTKKVNLPSSVGGFSKELPTRPVEYYAGGFDKTKYRFSLQVDRFDNGNVEKVQEVIVDGLDEYGREKVKAQVSKFDNSRKLESITFCEGYLTKSEARGASVRLLGEPKESYQSFLNCKTVTNDICKKVNSPLGDEYRHTRHRKNEGKPLLMGFLKNAFTDHFEFIPTQKKNSGELKTALAPGGSFRSGRWPSSDHHNIVLQEQQDGENREHADWTFNKCKSVAAMVRPNFKMASDKEYLRYVGVQKSISDAETSFVKDASDPNTGGGATSK